jgi:hypothetical protein
MNDEDTRGRWLDILAAIESAKQGIVGYDLENSGEVASAIRDGRPKTAFLVRRLDDPHRSYYLIPWESEEGVSLVAQVDAETGKLLGVATFSRPTPQPFITAEKALEIAMKKFQGETTGEPSLVWKPCRQSTSPLRPLYQIPHMDKLVYVDMDGTIHPELTPLGRGG